MDKGNFIKKNDKIATALKKISGSFGKIICVTDNNKKLLGVITAGDIRRAILSGNDPNQSVKKIYNKNVSFIFDSELKNKKFSKSNFYNREINQSIFYMPVVDKKKRVKNILTTERIIELMENKNLKKKKKNFPKVLIVGGAGYIGSILCNKLLKKNYSVKIVDKVLYDKNVINKFIKNKNFSFDKADICDLNTQINVIRDVDVVVFLAEIVGDPACNARPEDALKTNYLSISSMAQLCSYLGISKFIYTSSCSVYGLDKHNRLLTEKSNLNPISHYARIKIMSEKALLANKNDIFKPTIFRLGTVFGPSLRNRFDLVVNTMAKNAYYNKKINLHGGEQWRPNIHVEDVADGIIASIKSNQKKVGNKIFNLSSDNSNFKIKDIAFAAKKIFKKSKIDVQKSMVDARNYRVSSKKFFISSGFRAKKTINQAYKEFEKLFRKNKNFNPNKKIFSNIKVLGDK
jgi:nucleoside-diphosphate-sugar epimerase